MAAGSSNTLITSFIGAAEEKFLLLKILDLVKNLHVLHLAVLPNGDPCQAVQLYQVTLPGVGHAVHVLNIFILPQ